MAGCHRPIRQRTSNERREITMLTVTPQAGALLAAILDQQGLPEDTAIRLTQEGQGIGMQPDNPRPDDTTVDHEGRTVLLLDTEIAELLAGNTLDLDGENLTLRPSQPGE
jgi:Fe-S cluster assembly iron-binding protein IscA